jgi:hypothetical protein
LIIPVEFTAYRVSSSKKYPVLSGMRKKIARVMKLVDVGDSKSPAARRAGSSPAPGTTSLQCQLVPYPDFLFWLADFCIPPCCTIRQSPPVPSASASTSVSPAAKPAAFASESASGVEQIPPNASF